MRVLRAVAGALARVEELAAASMVAAIVALVLAQVFFRRVLGRPVVWSEEFCTYAFIGATMLGGAAATHRRTHIRLTALIDRLPGSARITRVLEWLLAVGFAALVPGMVRFVLAVGRLGLRSPALDLPMTWIYGLAPLAMALFALHLIAAPTSSEGYPPKRVRAGSGR